MLWLYGLNLNLLVQCRGEIAVVSAFTALLQYCYITTLWIYGLTVIVLIQGRGEMAFLPAVTAILLNHIAMYIWTDCDVVCTGQRGYGGSACSNCSTVTSQCYGYMD